MPTTKKHAYRWEHPKHRDNWKSVCLKFDCVNRDIKCETCRRFSEYECGVADCNSRVNEN